MHVEIKKTNYTVDKGHEFNIFILHGLIYFPFNRVTNVHKINQTCKINLLKAYINKEYKNSKECGKLKMLEAQDKKISNIRIDKVTTEIIYGLIYLQ